MYKSAIVVPKSEITKYAKSSEKQVGDGEKTDTLTRLCIVKLQPP